jgi:hypothetical protein
MPGGLSTPALGLAIGTNPGPLLGPVLVNVALLVGLAVASWLVFRRQEL